MALGYPSSPHAAEALLREKPSPTRLEIAEALASMSKSVMYEVERATSVAVPPTPLARYHSLPLNNS